MFTADLGLGREALSEDNDEGGEAEREVSYADRDGFDAIIDDNGGMSDNERSPEQQPKPIRRRAPPAPAAERRYLQPPFQSGAFPSGDISPLLCSPGLLSSISWLRVFLLLTSLLGWPIEVLLFSEYLL